MLQLTSAPALAHHGSSLTAYKLHGAMPGEGQHKAGNGKGLQGKLGGKGKLLAWLKGKAKGKGKSCNRVPTVKDSNCMHENSDHELVRALHASSISRALREKSCSHALQLSKITTTQP